MPKSFHDFARITGGQTINSAVISNGYDGSGTNRALLFDEAKEEWTALTDVPSSFYRGGGATDNLNRYWTGGGTNGTGYEEYDFRDGQWYFMSSPSENHDNGPLSFYYREYWYVGGTDVNPTIERWDEKDRAWDSNVSTPNTPANYSASAVSKGVAYKFGGNGPSFPTNAAEKYEIAKDNWVTITSMPAGKSYPSAAPGPNGDYIYVVGGTDLYEYDIANDSWDTNLANPPTGISKGAMWLSTGGTQLYAYDGNSGDTLAYDISGDSWNTVTSVSGETFVSSGGFADPPESQGYSVFFLINGYDGSSYTADSDRYSVVNDSVDNRVTNPPIGTGRWKLTEWARDKTSVWQNGSDNDTYQNDFWRYDYAEDSWTQLTDCPDGHSRHFGFKINDSVFFGGGYRTTTVNEWDTSQGSWVDTTTIPTQRDAAATAVTESEVAYVIGGDSSGSYNALESYDYNTDSWDTSLTNAPFNATNSMGAVGPDGNFIYLFRYQNAAKYDISADSWTSLNGNPDYISQGSAWLTNSGEEIYVYGGDSPYMYSYDISGDSWTQITSIPSHETGVFGGY